MGEKNASLMNVIIVVSIFAVIFGAVVVVFFPEILTMIGTYIRDVLNNAITPPPLLF